MYIHDEGVCIYLGTYLCVAWEYVSIDIVALYSVNLTFFFLE